MRYTVSIDGAEVKSNLPKVAILSYYFSSTVFPRLVHGLSTQQVNTVKF